METITVDFSKVKGCIKPMHAVNNGPVHKENSQCRSNLHYFTQAGIPYVRNHDASFCANYGGEHTVDIHAVFPNFDADPQVAESYDFTPTDSYLKVIEKSGAKVFYRLGSKIEHYQKKYGTLPPKDFKKWAVICEHIIKHYTAGWADGFHQDIEYWEIWNEPDLDADDSSDKRTWGGTAAEFFEFFTIAATHLKSKFPHLKIGGPALAHNLSWMDDFLIHITNHTRVPLDFFSWHIYAFDPKWLMEKAQTVRKMLDKYGYTKTESILNEWNYVKDWNAGFIESIETIIRMKGAAFSSACMCISQDSPVDMLMYYDARPCAFNGMFDFYTLRPLKGYYPFQLFNELYKAQNQVECENSMDDIYAVGAVDGNQNGVVMLTYYTDEKSMPNKAFAVDALGTAAQKVAYYLLDNEHNGEVEKIIERSNNLLEVEMKPNTVVMLKFQ